MVVQIVLLPNREYAYQTCPSGFIKSLQQCMHTSCRYNTSRHGDLSKAFASSTTGPRAGGVTMAPCARASQDFEQQQAVLLDPQPKGERYAQS